MLIFAVMLTFLMLIVMITDVTRFIIPNLLIGALLILYPILLYTAPVIPDWKWALLIAGGVFIVGFIIFALNVMGGGDIKLLIVTSLFVGKDAFPEFIMGVGLLGGLLALLLLLLRQFAPYIALKLGKSPGSIPRVLTTDEPVPYGIAIAISFLLALWGGNIPGVAI